MGLLQEAWTKKHARCSNLLNAAQGRVAVLFLDVDGVLHPTFSPFDEELNADCISQLMRVCNSQTGCLIILSSAWREYKVQVERVHNALRAAGHETGVAGITPSLLTKGRSSEILEWLRRHMPAGATFPQWVCLDDYPLPGVGGHMVHVDNRTGLTQSTASRGMKQGSNPDHALNPYKNGA